MNQEAIKRTAEAVKRMEKEYLETKLQGKKLWKNTYVQKQIEQRKRGKGVFSLSEHIRGMVYAMISSMFSWKRAENYIDENTAEIKCLDEIFHDYNADYLLSGSPDCSPENLVEKIKALKLGSYCTKEQMKALIPENVKKLKQWADANDGNVDSFYRGFIEKDPSYHELIKTLSQSGSENKMRQMGEALTAEYLRNVGYDMAKPDRHIRRILGKNILGCSEKEIAPIFESMEIVREIANYLGRSVAEVDYILWSYCATGYGEICTKKSLRCRECVVRAYCKKGSYVE